MIRIDQLLVERRLFPSREQAQRALLAGEVRSGTRIIDKPGQKVAVDLPLEVATKPRFVGRGGLKLEAALAEFKIDVAGRACLDIGASTGGFTDCLLQHGAGRIYAYDVGHGQLDWRIRSDPRVVVAEGVNCRHLVASDLAESVTLVVIDVSFISLTKILPAAIGILAATGGGEAITLIKPQFELRREDVGKGGIVRDSALHQRAVEKIEFFVGEHPMAEWVRSIPSPIQGTDGNHEFLALIRIQGLSESSK